MSELESAAGRRLVGEAFAVLRNAEVAVDVAAPGSAPNPAKERELEALRRGQARIVRFWLAE